jgi:hypothetical protein
MDNNKNSYGTLYMNTSSSFEGVTQSQCDSTSDVEHILTRSMSGVMPQTVSFNMVLNLL